MKLWKKISLLCGIILALTVAACTYIQLIETRNTMVDLTCERLHQKVKTLENGFPQMVNYFGSETDTPTVERSLLEYCFSRLADSSCALIVDGEPVYYKLKIPMEALPAFEENVGQVHLANSEYFIEGVKLRVNLPGEPECLIYGMVDITGLDETIRQMGGQFLRIGLEVIAVGLLLIIFVVCRTMKPLQKLQAAASEIADGNYDRRVKVRSKNEVGALAVSFNHMADSVETHVKELRSAAERQRRFTSAVTHEFKTPLTGILLNADSLQNTCMSEEEQAEALYAIQEQGRWLERLVQKLLKLLTLCQEIAPEPVLVPELLEAVREGTAEILGQRGVRLDIQCSMETLRGDRDLLLSALMNLVDNASKASQPGSVVWLTAGGNRIEVADQGSGIPPESLNHVTEPFYTADRSRSKRQGGAGLGLTLVKEIAEAHGGTLEVESTPGIGTIVRMHFPT